jgi:hypothetical protein
LIGSVSGSDNRFKIGRIAKRQIKNTAGSHTGSPPNTGSRICQLLGGTEEKFGYGKPVSFEYHL